MKLRLQFCGVQVLGAGCDCAGPSEIHGAMDAEGTVSFVKTYSSHTAHYEGRWDGRMIAGVWTMRHQILFGQARFLEEKGEFEIWPETGELESVGDLFEEDQAMALTA